MKKQMMILALSMALSAPAYSGESCSLDEETSLDAVVELAKAGPPAGDLDLSQRQEQLCSVMESNLVRLQTAALDVEDQAFKAADQRLKEMYLKVCESASPSEHLMAEAERDLVELDESLAYLELFVARRGGAAPRILAPFESHHKSCASGCGYVSWGIWGDRKHQARRSCHNSGDAIDIHAIRCGGKLHKAGSARFKSYLGCMRGNFGVIFGNRDHRNHAHIQLRDCRKISGTLQGKAGHNVVKSGKSTKKVTKAKPKKVTKAKPKKAAKPKKRTAAEIARDDAWMYR